MKIIFFLGKGGVGKSSLSILSGLVANQQNKTVVLVSLDRAHNLFDILNVPASELPPTLKVIEADLDKFIRQYLKDAEGQLRKNYTYLTAINLEEHFKILRFAPGMEEYGLLVGFRHFYEKYKDSDYLIFDMPPTALALKFFGLPSVSLIWIKQLLNLRNEILKKKEIISGVKFGKSEVETDKVKNNLTEQQKRYESLLTLFRDERHCLVNVVSNPDPISLSESERIFEFLTDLQIPIHKLIINKSNLKNQNVKKITLIQKKHPIFVPQSQYPLVGISYFQKYLIENKTLTGLLLE